MCVKHYMEQPLLFLLFCVFAYLLGSIPVGFLVAKARGIDISTVGSGNIGATNIARNLGFKLGAVVGILDFFKSFIPIFLAHQVIDQQWQILVISILPVLGHIFPVWLNFKGGKGVSTIFGIIAGFFGMLPFLGFLLVWFLVVKWVKLMSLVNLVVGVLLPIAFWFRFNDLMLASFGLLLGLIIWWTHRENLKRLLAGEEHKIG